MTSPEHSTAGERRALVARIASLSRPLEPIPTGVDPRLKTLEGVRAVVWDLYGTLLVSGAGEVGTAVEATSGTAVEVAKRMDALREAFEACNVEGDLEAAATRGVELLTTTIAQLQAEAGRAGAQRPEVEIRDVWRRVLEQLAGEGLLSTTASDLERLIVEYECRLNPAWPMPAAREVLRELRRRGLLLGIVSNAQFYSPLVLEALFAEPLAALGFEPHLRVWSYLLKAAKPSRELFDELAKGLGEHHGLSIEQALFVGNDMLNDVQGAASAGCRTALFAGDRRSLRRREGDERVTAEPDVVITRLEQLLDVVGVR